MNIFDSVKAVVSARETVAFYGIKVNRNNMCCCPFHNDKHPSMKLDGKVFGRFYCFACGETGDVIDFVGKYFGLSNIDAAKKLAEDFGISYDRPGQGFGPRTKTEKELKREVEVMAKKEFAGKKQKLLQMIAYIRRIMHDKKLEIEAEAMQILEAHSEYAEAMQILEAHSEYAEAIAVLQIIDMLQDEIYDNRDEDLMKRWSEFEKEVNRLAERISKIRCGCNKAS